MLNTYKHNIHLQYIYNLSSIKGNVTKPLTVYHICIDFDDAKQQTIFVLSIIKEIYEIRKKKFTDVL